MDFTSSPLGARTCIDLDHFYEGQTSLKLSVVMPVHNEIATIEAAVTDVLNMRLTHPFELIVVDDGSTDGTSALLSGVDDPKVLVHRHASNRGKGAAILSGAALATGSHLVIFEAHSEYRASDLVHLFQAIVDGMSAIVFGVRVFGMNTVFQSYRHAIANRLTTLVANVLFDAYLSDLHSGMKLVPTDLFRSLQLTQSGVGLDAEITAELLRRGYRPYEIPVSYISRSNAQGRKLTWRDALDCLAVLSRVRARGLADDEAGPAPAPPQADPRSSREVTPPEGVDDRAHVALLR